MILVTGGCGYIGSHTVVKLIESGKKIIILDNLSNSSKNVVFRLKEICGILPEFIVGDVRDRKLLKNIFLNNSIDSVIHFAGLKSVSEGSTNPLAYYENNVNGCLALLEEMASTSVRKFIFSSSATVYGSPQFLPYTEAHPLGPINVYGQTKLMAEQILHDLHASDPSWKIGILRYFNPVGAHISGLIGEDPSGLPNNLMPFLSQVAVGKRDYLSVYGNDYPTEDGTGKRDYIHVDDLASGHIAALEYLAGESNFLVTNLGTGFSTSVFELIRAFEGASNRTIPYRVVPRRVGDLAEYYADPRHANVTLGWAARHDLTRMCTDTWRWQKMNPDGYK